MKYVPEGTIIFFRNYIMSFTFFFAAIKHEYKEDIIKSLDKYITDDTSYLISMETTNGAHSDTNGEHFHFAVSGFEEKYDSFRKWILVKQFGLRGQATAGKPRQYGKIKANAIRDETKFLAYMCKDYSLDNNNIIYKNLLKDNLLEYIEKSYKKTEKLTSEQMITWYLDDVLEDGELYVKQYQNERRWIDSEHPVIDHVPIVKYIIQYYIDDKEKVISKSKVDYYVKMYIQRSPRYCKDAKIRYFLDYLRI